MPTPRTAVSRWEARLMLAVASAVVLFACGGADDRPKTPQGSRSPQTVKTERNRVAFDADALPKEVTGSWIERIGPGQDTAGRTQLRPAGYSLCMRLTKIEQHGCYAAEPLRGPGAEQWRREKRGRFVEYGLAGLRDGKLVWRVLFEPLGVCAHTESAFSYSRRGRRLTLQPVKVHCGAHESPLQLSRE